MWRLMLLTESKAQLQHFQSETATVADTVVGAGILACWKIIVSYQCVTHIKYEEQISTHKHIKPLMQTPNVEVKDFFWDGTHLHEQRQSWRWIQPRKFWQNVERGGDGVGDVWSGG